MCCKQTQKTTTKRNFEQKKAPTVKVDAPRHEILILLSRTLCRHRFNRYHTALLIPSPAPCHSQQTAKQSMLTSSYNKLINIQNGLKQPSILRKLICPILCSCKYIILGIYATTVLIPCLHFLQNQIYLFGRYCEQ